MRFVVWAGAAALALVGALAFASAVQAARVAAKLQESGRLVPVKGGRLNVVMMEPASGRATGLPIVLLHGASGNLGDMRESIGRRLAQRHRVILIDRPGHGMSDRLGGREMASPARQADAIAEALDQMKVGRAVVVGHSWSGALATNLALDHPDHVAGLVLLSPATHPWPGGVAWYNNAAATPGLGLIFAATVAAPVGLVTFDKALESVFDPRPVPENYAERTQSKLLLRPAEFQANAQDLSDLKAFLKVQSPRYGAIRVPTTIVTADKDQIVVPEIHARLLNRQIRGSKLVVLKDASHMTHWTETERVLSEIESISAKAR